CRNGAKTCKHSSTSARIRPARIRTSSSPAAPRCSRSGSGGVRAFIGRPAEGLASPRARSPLDVAHLLPCLLGAALVLAALGVALLFGLAAVYPLACTLPLRVSCRVSQVRSTGERDARYLGAGQEGRNGDHSAESEPPGPDARAPWRWV